MVKEARIIGIVHDGTDQEDAVVLNTSKAHTSFLFQGGPANTILQTPVTL